VVDLHSHILPGIDDGAESMADTVDMARTAQQDGVRCIVATPHHANGVYDAPRERVLELTGAVGRELAQAGVHVEVLPGAEVHFHAGLAAGVEAGTLCTLADTGKYLLVELPVQLLPPTLRDELFRLRLLGITPILAHVERNRAVQEDWTSLLPLLDMGVLFQCTAASLTGEFGSAIRELSINLVRFRLVHVLGTDSHGLNFRPPVLSSAWEIVREVLAHDPEMLGYMERLPELVLQGTAPPDAPAPRMPEPKPWWKRLFGG
jgi:protein-tyrosine phosphatase